MGVYRRIVAVQGSAQLTSALAAMRTCDRSQRPACVENHLVIHDLSAPSEQASSFASCLQDLSRQATSWASVRYITPADLERLDHSHIKGGWQAACLAARDILPASSCDQLLLGQNMLFINKLLQQCFPTSERACYGDGVGLNFTSDYYNPGCEPGGLRGIERWLRRKIKSLRGNPHAQRRNRPHLPDNAVDFHKYYLLIANSFDQQLPHFEQMDAEDFRELFAIFSESLPRHAQATCDQLEAALAVANQVVFLLTSNFSETKRMTLEGELGCCIDQVRNQCTCDNALLIVKPHPRDSLTKIDAIKREALKHFRNVVALTDLWTFFVPFESIFARFIAGNPRIAAKTSVVCSSSACVSLEFLYQQRCELGFGTTNIRQHFAATWQKLRQEHEADLHRLLARIRQQSSNGTVESILT
jgi:Alpha-2,8-polysialyltransferase (POLYST)